MGDAEHSEIEVSGAGPPGVAGGRRRWAGRIRWLVSWGLLLVLAGVVGARAVELARHGWRPTAPGEGRWLGWAGGNGWERAALGALPETLELEPGPELETRPRDTVHLVVIAAGPVRADWLRVRAQYRWPALRVAAATVVAEDGEVVARDGAAAEGLHRVTVRVTAAGAAAMGEGEEAWTPAHPTPVHWLLALVGALGVVALARWSGRRWQQGPRPWRGAFGEQARRRLALGVLGGGVAVFLARLAAAPLWSWDHHAIWGMKARRIAALGLEADLLAGPAFAYAAGHYPVGWPLLLAAAGWPTGDGLPGPTLFRLAHGAMGCLLIVLVVLVVDRCGGRLATAATVAAWAAASPLLWDTESFGLADLPLAVVALLAVGLLSPGRPAGLRPTRLCPTRLSPARPTKVRLALAGLALGLLPWIKQEGWVLLVTLSASVALPVARRGTWWGGVGRHDGGEGGPGARHRHLLALLTPLGLAALAAPLLTAHLGGEGRGFLVGDWQGRSVERLGRLPAILGALGEALADPAWLGLWWVAPLACGVVWARSVRHRRLDVAAGLGLVVAIQLAVYGGIYLATYLDPEAHIASSLVRIAAALGPLAAVVTGCALGGARDAVRRDRSQD